MLILLDGERGLGVSRPVGGRASPIKDDQLLSPTSMDAFWPPNPSEPQHGHGAALQGRQSPTWAPMPIVSLSCAKDEGVMHATSRMSGGGLAKSETGARR